MEKVIFFDVDGTLTGTKSGATFKQDSQDIQLLEGVAEGIKYYQSQGWIMIGISNQGGCSAINKATGKPFKTIDEVVEEMQNTFVLVPQLERIYFCPDFKGYFCYKVEKHRVEKYDNSQEADVVPFSNYDSSVDGFEWQLDAEFNFRKPGYRMLTLALQEFDCAKSENIWMIGDRLEDEQAASAAGINFIWADTWRSRFCKGMQQLEVTQAQLEFLEGIKIPSN